MNSSVHIPSALIYLSIIAVVMVGIFVVFIIKSFIRIRKEEIAKTGIVLKKIKIVEHYHVNEIITFNPDRKGIDVINLRKIQTRRNPANASFEMCDTYNYYR
ncbi:MAG TPA: hypothetical protein VG738_14370 [Chitinophagaceae bacterium]|nr:hypothetical protein [Chitinophagaceae bacterium]